jgi:hypothetical protein
LLAFPKLQFSNYPRVTSVNVLVSVKRPVWSESIKVSLSQNNKSKEGSKTAWLDTKRQPVCQDRNAKACVEPKRLVFVTHANEAHAHETYTHETHAHGVHTLEVRT